MYSVHYTHTDTVHCTFNTIQCIGAGVQEVVYGGQYVPKQFTDRNTDNVRKVGWVREPWAFSQNM